MFKKFIVVEPDKEFQPFRLIGGKGQTVPGSSRNGATNMGVIKWASGISRLFGGVAIAVRPGRR